MKFSIRDLLLVTVIVAFGLGWWLNRSRLHAKVRDLEFKSSVEKHLADMAAAVAKAEEDAARVQADYAKARDVALPSQAATEGPLRGYNLLGPRLPKPQL
jgi:hypothetical protein